MCALFHHPLFSSGEKRQRELQLGCGCAGDDARLRGNNDVLRGFWAKPYSYIILANQT